MANPVVAGYETVEKRFVINTKNVATRVMNLVVRAANEEAAPKEKLPDASKLNFCIDVLDGNVPPEFQMKPEKILVGFFEGSYSVWKDIYKRDQKELMGVIGKLLPKLPLEVIESYKNLLSLKNKKGEMIVTEMEIKWLWYLIQMMVRQCIDYGLAEAKKSGKFTTTKLSLTLAELETLQTHWANTKSPPPEKLI